MKKNTLILITFAFSLALLSGCGGLMGRGGMAGGGYGGYGSPGYGASGPYGSSGGMGGPMMGSGYGSGPMVGSPGMTPGALPAGARGRVMPYGGSAYYGTGYTSPEAVANADMARRSWRDAASMTPTVPLATSPCASGSCPLPAADSGTSTDAETRARLEAIEDQLLADHATH